MVFTSALWGFHRERWVINKKSAISVEIYDQSVLKAECRLIARRAAFATGSDFYTPAISGKTASILVFKVAALNGLTM